MLPATWRALPRTGGGRRGPQLADRPELLLAANHKTSFMCWIEWEHSGEPLIDGFNELIVDFLFELVLFLDSTQPLPIKNT